ncbi:MAG: hypothetical protein GXY55_02570 [Phycisphaerae bacterium]|nr:hypothetical protein [Phycisphaerae bacterium]
MQLLLGFPDEVLDQPVDGESLRAYLEGLDLQHKRHSISDHAHQLSLLLISCGYQTIRQVHEAVMDAWDQLGEYEANLEEPLSAGLAVLYALMIGSRRVRRLLATDQDRQELTPYFVGP